MYNIGVLFGISVKTKSNKTTQIILNQLVSIKCLLYVQQNDGICGKFVYEV